MASESRDPVAIFWDYENVHAPSGVVGTVAVNNIKSIAHRYGSATTFRAYIDLKLMGSRSTTILSDLEASGVTVKHCPHNGRKNVADRMIIVDMMLFALDHPPPATFILISGDGDFVCALEALRSRNYNVVVIAPKASSRSIKNVASLVFDWHSDILNTVVVAPSALCMADHGTGNSVQTERRDAIPSPLGTFEASVTAESPTSLTHTPGQVKSESLSIASERVTDPSLYGSRYLLSFPSRSGDDDDDSIEDFYRSVLPSTTFEHLLLKSRSCSPAAPSMTVGEAPAATLTTPAVSRTARTTSVVSFAEQFDSYMLKPAEHGEFLGVGTTTVPVMASRPSSMVPVPSTSPAFTPAILQISPNPSDHASHPSSAIHDLSLHTAVPSAPGTSSTSHDVLTFSIPPPQPSRPTPRIPHKFKPLIRYLEQRRRTGAVLRQYTAIHKAIWKGEEMYERAGTRTFKTYMLAAVKANIIEISHPAPKKKKKDGKKSQGKGCVALKTHWHGVNI